VDVREGEVVDARLFMTICSDHVEEWERSVRGGWDIWARAEEFIAKKEAGEIKGSFHSSLTLSYCSYYRIASVATVAQVISTCF
jgi:hypothetical protein